MSQFKDVSEIPNVTGRIEGRDSLSEYTRVNLGSRIDSVAFSSYNDVTNTVTIRLDHSTIPSFWIEIPLNLTQLSEFVEIEKESIRVEEYFFENKKEMEIEKNMAVDMGEYDIGQDEGRLNWMGDELAKLIEAKFPEKNPELIRTCTRFDCHCWKKGLEMCQEYRDM